MQRKYFSKASEKGARYLFFDSARLQHNVPDPAEKNPSIIVRQTEITLRVLVVDMGRSGGGRALVSSLNIYFYYISPSSGKFV